MPSSCVLIKCHVLLVLDEEVGSLLPFCPVGILDLDLYLLEF